MHTTRWRALGLSIALLVATLHPAVALAQPTEDIGSRMAAVLHYSGVTPSPDEVTRMTALWIQAQDAGSSKEVRRDAFRDMLQLYARLRGRDRSPQTFEGIATVAANAVDGGARMNLSLPEPRATPSGQYLHVDTQGTGPTRLLLISDLGVDGRKLYASFAARQASAYTMDIVTLPFAGAAKALPWPERLDYAGHPWLGQIERELLALLDTPRMQGVTIVGTSAGGYFAARLALLRPKQVRAVILVSALVHTPFRAPGNPDAPATWQERLDLVRMAPPMPQLFPVASMPPSAELRRLVDDPASTHPAARNWMNFAVKDNAVSRAWSFEALSSGFFVPSLEYGWELTATDLTDAMRELTVPTLAMGTRHDESSGNVTLPSVSQWDKLKLRHPTIPLTVATFDDTRAYVSADAPDAFDRALADFLAGRPVYGKVGISLPRTSPRASVMQSVGRAQIEIVYGRPAVKGRKIWGALVRNGRVWRAGANEATQFTTSADITIEGQALSAGTYAFFVIPGDDIWTLVFNRIPRQWGAFDYDPAFDALRVVVTPVDGPHEEQLRYRIESADTDAGVVTLAWETRTVSFRIKIAP